MQGRSKMLTVIVVVLSDCLFFLQENSAKTYPYSFFNPENKAGVVTLQKLLIREKAQLQDSRSIYIISSNIANPEMYELKVQNPKDKQTWIQSIRSAVVECPLDDSKIDDNITADQKQRHIDERQATIRELIGEWMNVKYLSVSPTWRENPWNSSLIHSNWITHSFIMLISNQIAHCVHKLTRNQIIFISSRFYQKKNKIHFHITRKIISDGN